MTIEAEKFDRIQRRLTVIHQRIQQIADMESKAAWVNGYGANGEFWPEKKALLDETDALLDKWEKLESGD
jgi:hypothetical protein